MSRLSDLQTAIDLRLADVWAVIPDDVLGGPERRDVVGCLVRIAYARGYADAAESDDPLAMLRELGYA